MKKGFTLVELLAVIVILGIISLITVPIVLKVVNDATDESEKQSVALYSEAIKTSALNYEITDKKRLSGSFTTTSNGHTLVNEETNEEIPVDFSKTTINCMEVVINTFDDITLRGCKVGNSTNTYSYSSKTNTTYEPICVREVDKDGFDTVTCDTESFYVMSEDVSNGTITALTKYNLNVGENLVPNAEVGIQNSQAIGSINSANIGNATITFSNDAYWRSDNVLKSEYAAISPDVRPYIYDSNSNLYEYVETYKSYLIEKGVEVTGARLMKYEEAVSYGCDYTSGVNNCTDGNAPTWVYSTSYWLGSSTGGGGAYDILHSGRCWSGAYATTNMMGVRPVVVISKSSF